MEITDRMPVRNLFICYGVEHAREDIRCTQSDTGIIRSKWVRSFLFFDKNCSAVFNHQDTKTPRHNEKRDTNEFAFDLL
jgi:hypothetical protein